MTTAAAHPVAVPGLHQTTVIVKFRPRSLANASGDPSDHRAQCPELYIDPDTKLERPPWYPGFVYRELGMVFKRFFFSYCELQILFSHLEGERLLRQGNGSELPCRRLGQQRAKHIRHCK
ncbi:MAG: hypothetical protein J0H32_10490 [Rhizobiales bacterium]|nr:hypothetical protein [Hyphomicrobiales bacterium]